MEPTGSARTLILGCSHVFHLDCLCGFLVCGVDFEPSCCLCRVNWSDDDTSAIVDRARELWAERGGATARRFVILRRSCEEDPFFHMTVDGEASVCENGQVYLADEEYAIQDISWPGDEVHDFVANACGGRWPMFGQAVKVSSPGLRLAGLFDGFKNPTEGALLTLRNDGALSEVNIEPIRLKDIKTFTVLKPWRAFDFEGEEPEFYLPIYEDRHRIRRSLCSALESRGLVIGKVYGDARNVHGTYTLLGVIDDAVSPKLSLFDGVDVLNVRLSSVSKLFFPQWIYPMATPMGLQPAVGQMVRVRYLSTGPPALGIFCGYTRRAKLGYTSTSEDFLHIIGCRCSESATRPSTWYHMELEKDAVARIDVV
jgi:hypothetical protein